MQGNQGGKVPKWVLLRVKGVEGNVGYLKRRRARHYGVVNACMQ